MTVTTPPTTPSTYPLSELERLRVQVAHLQVQVAQLQAQLQVLPLAQERDSLIRQTMLQHLDAAALEGYVIDLEHSVIRPQTPPHTEEPLWEPTP